MSKRQRKTNRSCNVSSIRYAAVRQKSNQKIRPQHVTVSYFRT